MSTYWGLHCIVCPETEDVWSGCEYTSSYKDDLSKYARNAVLIKQFRENTDLPDDLRVRTETGSTDFLDWLSAHAGHSMMLYNENGHLEPLQEKDQ